MVELGRKGGKGLDWIIMTAVRFEHFAFASRQIQIRLWAMHSDRIFLYSCAWWLEENLT